MTIIRTDYKNLIGGVSQQPNSVRIDNQCEVQDNAGISIVDGLGKRQPTEHIRSLVEESGLSNPFVHWINRDSTERYVVIADKGLPRTAADPIHIYDLATGTKMYLEVPTLTNDEVYAYLYATTSTTPRGTKATADAKRDLRAVTIADTTFILNRTVTTKMDESFIHDAVNVATDPYTDPPVYKSKSARRYFLFQRTANPINKYAVRVHTKRFESQNGTGPLIWDPPIETITLNGTTLLGSRWHEIATSWVKCFDLIYTNKPGGLSRGWGGADSIPQYIPKYDSGGLSLSTGHFSGYCIPTIQTNEVLERLWTELREGYFTSYPFGGHGKPAAYHGGIQSNFNSVRRGGSYIGSRLIAEKWTSGKINQPYQLTIPPLKNGVMKLELLPNQKLENRDYSDDLIVEVVERGDEEDSLIAFSDSVDRVTQLPLTCEHGHTVKILGLEDNENDEFYAEFVANLKEEPVPYPTSPHNMAHGHWKEGLAPLSRPRIEKNTMPLKLTRVNDSARNLGYKFILEQGEWDDQLVGDDKSNPNPSFIDQELEDMFLWRNRLGFLSRSRFLMSEADVYGNFWRTTVKQLLDSDPIDLDAGHNQVADLNFATPFEDELVVWTDRTQFVAQGNPLLTPTSATIVPTTNFENDKNIRPIPTERGVFFAYPVGGGKYSQIDFYRRLGDVSNSFDAFKSSGQIPRYIEGRVQDMTATSLKSILAVRAATNSHIIYIHKWLDNGADRVLSAWMRYIIGPSDTTTIWGMQFIEDELYILVSRTGAAGGVAVHLEKMEFSGARQVDEGSGTTDSAFRCFLDRRLDESQVTAVYWNEVSETVDIQLPYHVQDTNTESTLVEMKIVSRPDTTTGLEGEIFTHYHETAEVGSTKISVLKIPDPAQAIKGGGSLDDFKFWVGMSYTMTYEFSEPSLRDRQQGRGATEIKTGRYQVLHGTLSFEDSAYFTLTVSPKLNSDGSVMVDRDDMVYTLPLLEVGLGRSKLGSVNVRDGTLKFGIYSAPELMRLILENDSPFPSNPKALELEGNYSRRSKLTTF